MVMLEWFRRCGLMIVASIITAAVTTGQAKAQGEAAGGYPQRPIRMIVGFAAGGANDVLARIVGQKMSQLLGQPVVVENQAGAGGRLSAGYVMGQPADGYTLLVGATGTMSVERAINQDLPYHPTRTFVPLAVLAHYPLMLVTRTEHPAKTLDQLVEWAKANPNLANYGTTSPVFTIASELLKSKTGMLGTAIFYKGTADVMMSVLSGDSAFSMQPGPPTISSVKEGKVRALAVTGVKRMRQLPDVPSFTEIGYPDIVVELWTGLFARAGTPPAILAKIEGAVKTALEDAEVRQKIENLAVTVGGPSGDAFRQLIDAEIKRYMDVIATSGLKFGK
jgi:tripartite-type tricarboxylate transporter receptor subunit TctC